MLFDVREMINGNETLQRHKELLKTFGDDRVMCVGYEHDGTFYIVECCDEWYYHDLTKEECIELSELFKEIAEEISTIEVLKEQVNG